MSEKFSALFTEAKHRCIYCGKDLLSSFDDFYMTEEDHLIPKSKADKAKDIDLNSERNFVIACKVCNLLKGDHFPEDFDLLKEKDILSNTSKREKLISKIREYVF